MDVHQLLVMKTMQNIPALTYKLCCGNLGAQFSAISEFIKILSTGNQYLVDEVIKNSRVVSQFVKFLSGENIDMQSLAAGALTWIAKGSVTHKMAVIVGGAVEPLMWLLESSDDEVIEQALGALNNIASDSSRTRNHLLYSGVLVPLLSLLENTSKIKSKLSIFKRATLTLLNLCRGTPPPPFDTFFEQIKPSLPALRLLLFDMPDEVLTNVCWFLSCLTRDSPKKIIEAIVEANYCPILVGLLSITGPKATEAALLTLGDISAVTNPQLLIDAGISHPLKFLLTQRNKNVLKTACWLVSNLTAGNKDQIQVAIDNNHIVSLIYIMKNTEFEIAKEAAWAICNATNFASFFQIMYIVNKGCIKGLCDLLPCTDSEVVRKCLKALEKILETGEIDKNGGPNKFVLRVNKCDGMQKIQGLKRHENNEIRNSAVAIFNRYWP